MAEGIVADRAWDRLPILADALNEIGCDADEITDHLRSGSPHQDWCWAVDLFAADDGG